MTTAFAKVGFSGDFAGHYFLHRMIGTAKARELYFTAEILDSAKIDALGLANRVVADDQLEAETMKLAHQIANGPRVAWGYMKRNMKAAEETCALIKDEGGEAVAYQADVSKSDQVKAMVDVCLSCYGNIDVLQNNVGIVKVGGPVELSEADWDRVHDVNLKSFYLTCKYV